MWNLFEVVAAGSKWPFGISSKLLLLLLRDHLRSLQRQLLPYRHLTSLWNCCHQSPFPSDCWVKSTFLYIEDWLKSTQKFTCLKVTGQLLISWKIFFILYIFSHSTWKWICWAERDFDLFLPDEQWLLKWTLLVDLWKGIQKYYDNSKETRQEINYLYIILSLV